MTWNFNIEEAPRGHVERRTRNDKNGKAYEYDVHVPEVIIVASQSCDTVTLSKWLPEHERWEMLAKGEEPLAWMPFPEHPNHKS